jgi:hypothetical protein
MPSGPASYHFWHITVTADTDTVLEGKSGARKVESYGLSTPPMVSYHGLVTNEGKWFEGQSYGVKGTHTINDKKVPGFPHDLNKYGYAVAIMQNVKDEVTDAQVRTCAMAFAAAELDGYVKRGAPIYPHRKFAWKECPGDKAVSRLAEVQKLKDQYVRNGLPKAGTAPTPKPTPPSLSEVLQMDLNDVVIAAANGQPAVTVRAVLAKVNWLTDQFASTGQFEDQLDRLEATLDRIEDDTDDGTAVKA